MAYSPMQRIHADYCGPFLGKVYALVIEDAYSRYPEVFLTTKATADFTRTAFRKFFAREGVPQVVVTDNGTHFNAADLTSWLKSIGCHPVFTAPRHPCSNGLAERFVRTLKTAIATNSPTTMDELGQVVDSFLLQYQNAVHSTTSQSPAFLFKGRNLRTAANFDTTNVTFFRGNDTRPCDGLLLGKIGSRMYNVLDTDDGTVHRRHIDQINVCAPSPSPCPDSQAPSPVPLPVLPSHRTLEGPALSEDKVPALRDDAIPVVTPSADTSSTTLDSVRESTSSSPVLRRSKRQRKLPVRLRDF